MSEKTKLDTLVDAVEELSVADATALLSAVQSRVQEARKDEWKQNGKYAVLKKEIDDIAEDIDEFDETYKTSYEVKIDLTAECEKSDQGLQHALSYGATLIEANYTAKVSGITNRNLRTMFQEHLEETLEGACMEFFDAAFPEQSKKLAKLQNKVAALREKIRNSGIPVNVFFEE